MSYQLGRHWPGRFRKLARHERQPSGIRGKCIPVTIQRTSLLTNFFPEMPDLSRAPRSCLSPEGFGFPCPRIYKGERQCESVGWQHQDVWQLRKDVAGA